MLRSLRLRWHYGNWRWPAKDLHRWLPEPWKTRFWNLIKRRFWRWP